MERSVQDESRALTGLRGLGAVLVLCHHVFLHVPMLEHPEPLRPLLQRGYMGVDLFFVLSGFVLSMVYGRWFESGTPGWRRIPEFLMRRVARLWPLHITLLCWIIALEEIGRSHGLSGRVILMNVLMVQAWGHSAELNPPAWSISTEMLAYLMFPFLAAPLLRGRFGAALGVVVTGAALALCIALAPPIGPARRGLLDIYFNYSYLPLLRCTAGFVLGMVTWRVGLRPGVQGWLRRAWVGPGALVAAGALLAWGTNDLVIYALLPVIIGGCHYGRGAAWHCLASGPLHRLGVLSYAIYLIHVVALVEFPFGADPGIESLTLYGLLVLGLAILAHTAIEQPGRRMLRSVGMRVVPLVPCLRAASPQASLQVSPGASPG